MNQFHRFPLTLAALAVLLVGAYGCGASSAPPPGAPESASEPSVKQGEEQTEVAASDEASAENESSEAAAASRQPRDDGARQK